MTTCPYCRKKISEHEAGRELDVCVAEAKGKKVFCFKPAYNKEYDNYFNDRVSYTKEENRTPYIEDSCEEVPHYSTDIRDAMELLPRDANFSKRKLFADTLAKVIATRMPELTEHDRLDGYWALYHLTALDICHAYLAATKESE